MTRMTRFSGWIAVAILVATAALPQRLSAQATPEGVKVHGHWVIEVRNADGTLAERREFQNALNTEGVLVLGALLTGQGSLTGTAPVGLWSVLLRLSASSSDRCHMGSTVTDIVCSTEATAPSTAPHVFKTLTKTLDNTTGAVRFQGSVTMASAATIIEVGTTVLASLAVTGGGIEAKFTSRTLASPIAVQATQSVSITVTISFS